MELSASDVDDISNKKIPMVSKADGNSRDGSINDGSLPLSNSSNSSEEDADDAESGVNIVPMIVGYDEDATKLSQSMDDHEDVLEFPPYAVRGGWAPTTTALMPYLRQLPCRMRDRA